MIEAWHQSEFTRWLGELNWGFPSAEILHLVPLATFFGAMVLVDLRLLGVGRSTDMKLLMHHGLRCARWAFAAVVLSGAFLFLFMPLEYVTNPAFRLKMVLIAIAGVNALTMHWFLLKDSERWLEQGSAPLAVRLSALLSLGLWIAVLACGRLIAYYYSIGL